MKKLAICCLYLLIVALASATIVETYQGTAFVKQYFYSSLPFAFLWAIVAVSILLFLINRKVAKRPATFMIHLAILVILGGALLTWLTGQHGHLHLSPGQSQSSFQTEKNAEQLPFSVTLTDFQTSFSKINSPQLEIRHLKNNQQWEWLKQQENNLTYFAPNFHQINVLNNLIELIAF